ncbi:hypothetical protein CASFOL_020215 [Castilleja foliolosa]|uniref:Uncharacterized protein n=1 Tax=Castilleja foliolosa TaxID=1961234 RepID=A0ABD3D082_9LAMI
MEPEKMKLKTEPENDMEMLLAAYQSIQPLPGFDMLDLEFENYIIESENQTQRLKNLSDVRIIKTEEVGLMINEPNDDNLMLFELNNKLWELKNQILEKDRLLGAYRSQEETKLAKMQKEIDGLKVQKQMDDRVIEDLRSRLLVLEKEKKTADRNANELLKAEETVKELRRSSISELNVKGINNKVAAKTGTVSRVSSGDIIEIIDDFDKEKHGSSSPVSANDGQTKKRKEISMDCCHVHRRLALQRK